MMARLLLAVALVVGLWPAAVVPAAPASPQPAAPVARDRTIPVDPQITTGTLPNGLKYFIRRNGLPENRVLLRLAVDVGSVYEADDQRGLAHLLEHMAFNGTANFEPGELVSFFELAGAQFGPHVNASTGFDQTIYMLQVATDRAGLVEKALLALSDFAGRISLDPEEVDKERGVVIEEWRLRQGSSWRILERQAPVLFHESRYAERLPIGTTEVLRTFPVERLRDFYDTWYRPDRMAVVVVGAIDPAEVETMIQDSFGDLKARRPAAPVPDRIVPTHADTLIDVAADTEAQASTVSILRKRPPPPQGTVGDYRDVLVERLMMQMLNLRLAEIARREDAPFLGAAVGSQSLTQTASAISLNARVEDGGIPDGLEALILEARRAREFGFSADELDRAKKSLGALLDRLYAERDKTESASYAREYVSHFLTGEPIPGLEYEYRMANELLKGITVDEVSDAARELLAEDSRVVLAASPEKTALQLPTEAELRTVLTAAAEAPVTAWTDATAGRELMADEPLPGEVTGSRAIDALGITVLTLSNGVDVWLKPTAFKNDQVLIGGYAPGGAGNAPADEFFETVLAGSLVNLAGVGGFTPPELARLLAGRIVSVSPHVDLTLRGVRGSTRPQDLETTFQLLYLTMTSKGGDRAAFDLMQRQLGAMLANRAQNPSAQFSDEVRFMNTGHHPAAEPLTAERAASLRLPVMQEAYTRLYGNAADFTFFVVGTFQIDDITPLVRKYLGSLPSAGRRTTEFRPVGFQFPESVERVTVEQGREPKSQTVLSFFADAGTDPREAALAEGAAGVLEIRLREILREELGGTYSVSASYTNLLPEPDYGTISVSFGSSPENADRLTEAVLTEVRRLQREGPSQEDCAKIREQETQAYELALKQNTFWLGTLQSSHVLGRDPLLILERPARIAEITVDNVRAALRRYLPLERYTVGRLLPAPDTGSKP